MQKLALKGREGLSSNDNMSWACAGVLGFLYADMARASMGKARNWFLMQGQQGSRIRAEFYMCSPEFDLHCMTRFNQNVSFFLWTTLLTSIFRRDRDLADLIARRVVFLY